MSEVIVTQELFDDIVEMMQDIRRYIKNPSLSEEVWIDSIEVCRILCISTRTLQRRRNEYAIPFSKDGGRCYYLPSEIDKALRNKVIIADPQCEEDFRLNYINNA